MQQSLEDPDYVQLYLTFDESFGWAPDDPRLVELADSLDAYMGEDNADEHAPDDPALR